MADITLSAAIRTNLLSLQGTNSMIGSTQGKLSTGLKVGSVIDDAVAYFQGKALSDRAADFTERKGGIDQGISSIKAALTAIEGVEKIVKQMKGLVLSAKSADAAERKELSAQFNELAQQINHLANDASYQGLNLVNSTSAKLSVQFSDASAAKLDVTGESILASALMTQGAADKLASTIAGVGGWSAVSDSVSKFDAAIDKIDDALTTLRANAKTLGSNVALLQTRLEFTNQYSNELTEGSGKLTLADLNEEGANLVALQTRQQLGMQALAFAGQSDQAVLQLFR